MVQSKIANSKQFPRYSYVLTYNSGNKSIQYLLSVLKHKSQRSKNGQIAFCIKITKVGPRTTVIPSAAVSSAINKPSGLTNNLVFFSEFLYTPFILSLYYMIQYMHKNYMYLNYFRIEVAQSTHIIIIDC